MIGNTNYSRLLRWINQQLRNQIEIILINPYLNMIFSTSLFFSWRNRSLFTLKIFSSKNSPVRIKRLTIWHVFRDKREENLKYPNIWKINWYFWGNGRNYKICKKIKSYIMWKKVSFWYSKDGTMIRYLNDRLVAIWRFSCIIQTAMIRVLTFEKNQVPLCSLNVIA